MRKGKNRICHICGKTIKPGGIGGHIRLAHGIHDIAKGHSELSEVGGDISCDVCQDLSDTRERSSKKYYNTIKAVKEFSPEDIESVYLNEAKLLQKQYSLIHSIKALTESRLDLMVKEYTKAYNESSLLYMQKHKVTENYWCCWVWKRRVQVHS